MRALADILSTNVFLAIGNDWPAVVPGGADDVQFIAALRAMFVYPENTRRVQGCALDIPVAVTEDFRPCAGPLQKRIVVRKSAVIVQADDRARMVAEVLCTSPFTPVAELSSWTAPTTTVSPDTATEQPNQSIASVLEALR